ncbi:MAG: OmpA family protein [Saprospiraceae bacterium]|nr:OmpA family protein [Saprospiraceae bacterium]
MRVIFSLLCLFGMLHFAQAQNKEEADPYYIYSIYFGGGSYYIDDEQSQGLSEWLKTIPYIDDSEISIHSHTDNIGSKRYNEWLSKMRSNAAWKRLLEEGIPPEFMSIEDFGELNPVYDNDTWEGKLKNRRVDIIIKPIVM